MPEKTFTPYKDASGRWVVALQGDAGQPLYASAEQAAELDAAAKKK